jgi:hypothetical protein
LKHLHKITIKLKHLLIKVAYFESEFKVYYEDDGAFEIFPQIGAIEEFKVFKSIDDFDINGAIHEYH